MYRQALFGTTLLSSTALMASGVAAEITGADVWTTYTSYYEATGAQVIGEPQTNGAETVIADPALLYRFPFNIATIRIGLPDLTFSDQSDGTVTISYPETFDLTIEVDVPQEGSGSGTLAVTQTGYSGVASGDPGNVTFTQSADGLTFELSELTLPEEEIDLQVLVESEGYSVTSQVTEGELISVTSDMVLEPADVAYVVTDPSGMLMTNTGTFGRTVSTTEMALPAGGSSILNLSPALQAGAFLRGTSTAEGNSSETVVTADGEVISEQSTASGPTNATFDIGADGLDLLVSAVDSTFNMLIPDAFPFPIEGSVGEVVIGYTFPLLPSEEPQDVGVRFGLSDLTISEEIWALFDPASDLPRDPASINIDVDGTVISDVDWLNFATLEGQLDVPVPPISPETVTINDVSVSAIGAAAQGSGAFTLDMTDMETIPGFPRPEGEALLQVQGANALIDRLTALGVIGAEEAGMARLGMGFIARATGDDAFETAVEVNGEGHVIVNGQRMR